MKKVNTFLGLALSLAIVGCNSHNEAAIGNKEMMKPVKVKVKEVKKTVENATYTYSGIIEPHVSTSLSFQSIGRIEKIYVEEGQNVKKGQLLAKLDDISARSAYNAALATQKQAQDAYDRLKTVYDKGSLPEIQWEEIKSKLEQANASADMSKQNLENTKLRAPYAGVIGSRSVEIGSSVNPAISAFEIVTINKVYARISVPENEIIKFKKGITGTVNIPAVGAHNYKASVDKIGVIANRLSKTYTVKLIINNENGNIKPGMVCDTELEIENTNPSIAVPMQAVMNKPNENPYVFVLKKDDYTVNQRNIAIGSFSNSLVQVIDGLNEGEYIVINGQQKLVDNMKVTL